MSDLEPLTVSKQNRPVDLNDDVRLRWIPEYEGHYAVTDDGRVFSYKRNGPKKLATPNNSNGYSRVVLCKNGNRDYRGVHRLVLRVFKGPCPEGYESRHLNGVRDDNRLENLEWGTKEQNMADKKRHGTDNRGRRNPDSKLVETNIVGIRERYYVGESTQEELAEEFGVSQILIGKIVRGEIWAHVGGPISESNMERSNHSMPGEDHPNSKLTKSHVIKIRQLYDTGNWIQEELADKFHTTQGTIGKIIRGEAWKHVDGPIQD